MHSPLNFNNMCIIIDCLISPLLHTQNENKRCHAGINELWRKENNENFFWNPSRKVVTWKHSTRSPTLTFSHSKCSRGRERTRTDFLIFIHSSSSAPNPTNLTRTSCVLPCSTDFYHLLSSKYRWMWIIIKAFLPTNWGQLYESYLSIPCNLSQSSMLDYISLSHS